MELILYDAVSDREALVALFHSTRGQGWHNNENWLSDKPLSQWYGVQTNESGRVNLIELSSNGLIGTLPIELGHLEFLEYLDLSDNGLRDTIPSSFGGLSRLETLNLSRNSLWGAIPVSLANLTELRELILGHNKFAGNIPDIFYQLVNLEALGLNNNGLSGEIPPSLKNRVGEDTRVRE